MSTLPTRPPVPDEVRAVVEHRPRPDAVGLRLEHASEHLVDAALADRNPRAAKFAGWPLLLLLAARC